MEKVKNSKELEAKIKEYKAYHNDVINIMVGMPIYLKVELKAAISKMIDVYLKSNLVYKKSSIDKNGKLEDSISIILNMLTSKIKLYTSRILSDYVSKTSDLAIGNEDYRNNMDVYNFENDEIDGSSILDRIENYTSNFKHESEALILACLSRGMNKQQIVSEYANNISNVYDSEILKDAIRSNEFEAIGIKSKGMSYGKGISSSAFTALTLVMQDSAYRFYNKMLNKGWLNDNNIEGWITIRGGMFDCPLCDSQAYVFHPKTELFQSWHRRCVCICVPITKNMI